MPNIERCACEFVDGQVRKRCSYHSAIEGRAVEADRLRDEVRSLQQQRDTWHTRAEAHRTNAEAASSKFDQIRAALTSDKYAHDRVADALYALHSTGDLAAKS